MQSSYSGGKRETEGMNKHNTGMVTIILKISELNLQIESDENGR